MSTNKVTVTVELEDDKSNVSTFKFLADPSSFELRTDTDEEYDDDDEEYEVKIFEIYGQYTEVKASRTTPISG